MLKKILSSALALCMVFGTAAVLPEGAVELGSDIVASANDEDDYEDEEYQEEEVLVFGDYTYGLRDDGSVIIKEYNGKAQTLRVPSEIDGKKVTAIESYAFENTSLTSIILPETITIIDAMAFNDCKNLKSITLSDSIEDLTMYAFYECSALESINMPKCLTKIGINAFLGCTKLKNVVLPSGLKTIDGGAFYECKSFTDIVIPDGVTAISDYAFFDCNNLKSIEIPSSVTQIGEKAIGYIFGEKTDRFTGEILKNPNTVIKCKSGSAAEKYAKENNIKYELLDKPAHTHSYTTKVIKPTYDAQGYTLHTCSCGDSYKDTYTAKLVRTSIAKATVSSLSNKTYTGKAIKQTPVVKLSGKTLKSGTDYTVTYKNNKAVGTATVTITGKGAYTGTVSKTFKICPKKTTLKSVKSPKTKQLKVTYSKVAGVTGYQVTYSTSAKFTKATTKSVNVKGTSKTISKLTKGKTYYVKVRSYKTVGKTKFYSGYSAVKKVKVK
ncbi:leucine-rich repeat protein [Ruminococcus sp. NK3A76]|uniref:leucine-rich repeat protein n=1 Tax=Ruminococcus sp. NK3A76 TaxID=877411 RepID=UPI0004919BA1|nr:leucine-rich repeat protein [Ruminococcus sp. NK3A76]